MDASGDGGGARWTHAAPVAETPGDDSFVAVALSKGTQNLFLDPRHDGLSYHTAQPLPNEMAAAAFWGVEYGTFKYLIL